MNASSLGGAGGGEGVGTRAGEAPLTLTQYEPVSPSEDAFTFRLKEQGAQKNSLFYSLSLSLSLQGVGGACIGVCGGNVCVCVCVCML